MRSYLDKINRVEQKLFGQSTGNEYLDKINRVEARLFSRPQPEGMLGALKSGVQQTGNLLGTAANVVSGDTEDVQEYTRAAGLRQGTPEQQSFRQQVYENEQDDDGGLWNAVKNVAGAAWENPKGALHETISQLPNSGVVMGSMGAGAKIGALSMAPVPIPGARVVGAIAGGVLGLLFGNSAIETGAIAQEEMQEGAYNRGDVLRKGATKGAVITGVDAATMGATSLMFKPFFRAANKAAQNATVQTLKRAGVDTADDIAIAKALQASPELLAETRKAAARAAAAEMPKGFKGAGLYGTATGLEILGEGTGEYAGSVAAGVDASLTDAVMESMMSIPQSAGQAVVGRGIAKATTPAQDAIASINGDPVATEKTDERLEQIISGQQTDWNERQIDITQTDEDANREFYQIEQDIQEQRKRQNERTGYRPFADLDQQMDEAGVTPLTEPVAPEAEAPVSQEAEQVAGDDKGKKSPLPGKPGKKSTAYTNDNTPVEFTYQAVPLESLIPSHDDNMGVNPAYPKELQPRDRSRVMSSVQVENIAKKLNPERLGENPSVAHGAPMVLPDGTVLSGNGRVLALKKAAQTGNFDKYREYLAQNAEKFGTDGDGVLVRVVDPKSIGDLVSFAQKANESDVAKMSATEQAVVDAGNLTEDDMAIFRPSEDGYLAAESNMPFLERFVQKMSPEERSGYLREDGKPNRHLVDRVQQAIFQKAYGSESLLKMTAEEANPEIKNILNGLQAGARDFARTKTLNPEMTADVVTPIMDAVEFIRKAQREYKDLKGGIQSRVNQALSQMDMFEGELSDEAKAITEYISRNVRSGKRIGELVREIGSLHRKTLAEINQKSIFGEEEQQGSIIERSIKKLEESYVRDQKSEGDQRTADQVSEGVTEKGRSKPENQRSAEKATQVSEPLQGDLFNANPQTEKQLDLFPASFGNSGTAKTSGNKKVVKADTTGKKKDAQGGVSLERSQRTGVETTGYIQHRGLVVESDADVAAIFGHLVKKPQEALYTVALDKDGLIIEILAYTKGLKTSSQANPGEMAGRAFTHKNTKKVYFVHNHPSGDTSASAGDRDVYRRLKNILRLRNISLRGVIVAQDAKGKKNWSAFGEGVSNIEQPMPENIKKTKIPVVERVFLDQTRGPKIDGPLTAKAAMNNRPSGFILVNHRLEEVGFLPFPVGMPQREITALLIESADRTNATGYIAYTKEPENKDRTDFLIDLQNAIGSSAGGVAPTVVEIEHKDGSLEHIMPPNFDEYPEQGYDKVGGSTPVYSIAGDRASTADSKLLSEAKRMKAAGKTRSQIWKKTGWYELMPGKWAFEIDDSKIQIKKSGVNSEADTKLSDVIKADDLFQAYPRLKDIDVVASVDPDFLAQASGSFLPKAEKKGQYKDEADIHARGRTEKDLRSALIHEINHSIQEFEGFPQGGNLDAMPPEAMMAAMEEIGLENIEGLGGHKTVGRKVAKDYYKRLVGEAYARLAQKRRDMAPSQRRLTPPWVTMKKMLKDEGLLKEGQKPEDVLVDAGGGVAELAVYHGTPHIWPPEPGFPHGRPRLDKIGTGEGAAAYGWGWYSAESDGVAKTYVASNAANDGTPEGYAASIVGMYGTKEKALSHLRDILPDKGETTFSGESREFISKAISAIESGAYEEKIKAGSLYQLDIPDSVIPKLLDWDAPFAEQNEHVKKKLTEALKGKDPKAILDKVEKLAEGALTESITDGRPTPKTDAWEAAYKTPEYAIASFMQSNRKKAGDFYQYLPGGQKAASEYLASIGIPGNRYLDGMSRGKGEGSSNYVIWDQSVLDQIALLERNGKKLDQIRAAYQAVHTDHVPGQGLTIKDIQSRFPNQQVFLSPDGSISIRTRNGLGLRITSVEEIGGEDIRLAKEQGRMDDDGVILGKYTSDLITLNKSLADTITRDHEVYHWLVDHTLTKLDRAIVKNLAKKYHKAGKFKFKWSDKMEENEANGFAQLLDERERYRGKPLGRIIQKVQDFFDGLWHIGRMSARKLAREVESGKVYERQAVKGGQAAPMFDTVELNKGDRVTVSVPLGAGKVEQGTTGTIARKWGNTGYMVKFPGVDGSFVVDKAEVSLAGPKQRFKRISVKENKAAVSEYLKDKAFDKIQTNRATPGDVFYRVVWEADQRMETNPTDLTGLPESDSVSAIHVSPTRSEAENWGRLLAEDYDRGADWKVVEIKAMDGDYLAEDVQQVAPSEMFGRTLDSRILITGRPELNKTKAGTYYSTTTQDTAYLAAVERGDMETAGRMVADAAKAAGYTVGPLWRGSQQPLQREADAGKAIFFSSDEGMAKHFLPIDKSKNSVLSKSFIRIDTPYFADADELEYLNLNRARFKEISQNHDGIIEQNTEETEVNEPGEEWQYVVFNPNQIKSADPVTYDPQGNPIPLSQRFNQESNDVRYEVAGDRVSPDAYERIKKQNKNLKNKAILSFSRVKNEVVKGLDKYMGSISTRLGNINPKLSAQVKTLDLKISKKTSDDSQLVVPLLQKAKKMTRDDYAVWDFALKNSDGKKLKELHKKYDMESEYKKVRDMLDRIRQEAIDVGYDVGEIDEYWPRVLKDQQGFLEATERGSERPVFTDAIKKRAEDMGMKPWELSDEMKAEIISNVILGKYYGIPGPGAVKQRVFDVIPDEYNQFYMDSTAAIIHHIHSMRKRIEARKFFGKTPDYITAAKKNMRSAEARLRKAEDPDKIREIKKDIAYYGAIVEKYKHQRDYTDNIDTYILDLMKRKEINPSQENTVREVLTARFNEVGVRGLVQAYKNFSYIDTMGSFTSAITQIGDLAWSFYDNGFFPTLKVLPAAFKNKSRITRSEVGFDRIAQEFSDTDQLGKAVSWVFKWTGLEKVDGIGKETLMNAAYNKYKNMASSNPQALKKQISHIFENETDSVVQDLIHDDVTDNVRLLVAHKVLDFQPMSLSEMPEKYLTAGNGRIFYMLKTFTIKSFDVFRREAFNKLRSKDNAERIQGLKNLTRLATFFVLANAAADELKDLLLGRETELSDRLVDNILRLFGISKFVTWQARVEGVGTAAGKQIFPPFKFVDGVYKDIVTAGDDKGLKSLSSVPIVGKLMYWHMGRGTYNRRDLWEKRFSKEKRRLNKVRDRLDKSKDKSEFIRNNRQDLAALNRANKTQGVLNKLQKHINVLKSREQTKDTKNRIEQLQARRIEIIKRYMGKQ